MAEKAKDKGPEAKKSFMEQAKQNISERLRNFAKTLAEDDSSNNPKDLIPRLANEAKTIWGETTSSLLADPPAAFKAFFEYDLVKDPEKIKETAKTHHTKLVNEFVKKFSELLGTYFENRRVLEEKLTANQRSFSDAQESLRVLNTRLTGEENSEPALLNAEEKSKQKAIDIVLMGIAVALEVVIGQFLISESSTRIVAWLFSGIVAVVLTFFALQYGKCKKVISYAEDRNLEVKKSTITQKNFAKGMYAGTLAFLLLIRVIAYLIAQSDMNLLFEAVIVTASLIGLSVLSGYIKFSMASVYEESDIKTYEKALGNINSIGESIKKCEENLKILEKDYRDELEELIQSFLKNSEIKIPVEEIDANQSLAYKLLGDYEELKDWLKNSFYDAIDDIAGVLSAKETIRDLYFQEHGGKWTFKPEIKASLKNAIELVFKSISLKEYDLETLKNFKASLAAEEIRKSIILPDFKKIAEELEAEAVVAATPKEVEKIPRV